MPYRKLPPVRLKRGARPRRRAPLDPTTLEGLAAAWLDWQRVHHYAAASVEQNRRHLAGFTAWAAERGITHPGEVTLAILERFQAHLFHYRKANAQPLSVVSQASRLVAVRSFFRWLARQHHIPANPASELAIPKEPRVLKDALTVAEVERVLAQPDVGDVLGLRDRAMLELMYASGMRRSEVVALGRFDVDFARGTAHIRQGKGKKDRIVPVGERALAWLEKYLREARPRLESGHDDGEIFLTEHGERIVAPHLTYLALRYVRRSGVGKPGGCHLLRHTMATLMLEGGADIRFIQEMLGHASLETTEIYTHVAIGKLKAVHAATHPGARLARPDRDVAAEDAAAAAAERDLDHLGR